MSDTASEQPASEPIQADLPAPTAPKGRNPLANPLVVGLTVVVVAAVVLAVVLSGGSPAKPKPVASSPAAFTDAVRTTFTNGTFSATFSLSVASGTTSVKLTGSGSWSATQKAGEFVENVSGSKTLDAVGPLTELVVGKTLYLKFGPALSAVIPTPWVSTTIKDTSAIKGASPFKVPSGDTKYLAELPAILSSLQSILHVENLGAATVNGTAVTTYKSSFNTATVIASLKAQFPTEFQGVSSPTSAANVTVTASIDGQKRVRQLSVDITTTKGRPANVKLSLTFTSFGSSASYQAPPASQVTPLTQLLAREHLSAAVTSLSVRR